MQRDERRRRDVHNGTQNTVVDVNVYCGKVPTRDLCMHMPILIYHKLSYSMINSIIIPDPVRPRLGKLGSLIQGQRQEEGFQVSTFQGPNVISGSRPGAWGLVALINGKMANYTTIKCSNLLPSATICWKPLHNYGLLSHTRLPSHPLPSETPPGCC